MIARMKLSQKLITSFLAVALIASGLVGFGGVTVSSNRLAEVAGEGLLHETELRATQLNNYISTVRDELMFVSQLDQIRSAARVLPGAYLDHAEKYGDGALQKAYIDDNPHPLGEKHLLSNAGDGSEYSANHESLHPMLRGFLEARGYYDIFLFDLDGNLVYTVFKERDYATNLLRGEYKSSGLGEAYSGAMNAHSGAIVFEDFAPYAPSLGAPASFVATPIFSGDGEKRLGVLAFQIPSDRIQAAIFADLPGSVVESFLVGPDGLLHSDIAQTEANEILSLSYDLSALTAIEGWDGALRDGPGATGAPSIAAVREIDFLGAHWTLVAAEPRSIVNASIGELRAALIWIALFVGALTAVAAWFLAKSIVRPIIALQHTATDLAHGESVEVPGLERRDELGDMARAFAEFSEIALAGQRIHAAMNAASAPMAVTDSGFTIVYANPAMLAILRASEEYWRERLPGFSADNLVGMNIDDFHKNPELKRSHLHALTGPHEAEIGFGGVTARMDFTPIDGANGLRQGYVMQWTDRTAEHAAESEIEKVIEAARSGDFRSRVNVETDNNFIVTMAAGMNALCENVHGFLKDVDQALSGLARGDLRSAARGRYKGQFNDIAQRVDQTAEEIDRLVRQITTATIDINLASAEITDGSESLSSRAESQAASLEETAATMEEIAATVKTNADNAVEADRRAGETREQAEHGLQVVAETVQAMSNIRDSATEISDIVTTIDSIAFQTNLLALNAAVEAARAGDAGKGFAVVASEVRTLAQRSSEAAKLINELINKSTEHVAAGDRLVGATDKALNKILDGARNVAATIGEIAHASREQASGVDEVSTTVSQMDEMTQMNASLAEQSAAAARSLTGQSEALVELVRTFDTRDEQTERNREDKQAWLSDAEVERRTNAQFASGSA